MKLALVLVAGFLVLTACARDVATPTRPPYTGPTTRGVPTPGDLIATEERGATLVLRVRGDYGQVASLYAETWQAAGWTLVRRAEFPEEPGPGTHLTFARDADRASWSSAASTAARRPWSPSPYHSCARSCHPG